MSASCLGGLFSLQISRSVRPYSAPCTLITPVSVAQPGINLGNEKVFRTVKTLSSVSSWLSFFLGVQNVKHVDSYQEPKVYGGSSSTEDPVQETTGMS